MMNEIAGVMTTVRVLNDLVKANHTLRNFNELVAAVSEVNAKLSEAWAVALAAQEKQAALTQRVGTLEKEIAELKDWNRETECYQLTEVGPGVFAYRLKPEMKPNEPSHYLCANCFSKHEKGFLQLRVQGTTQDDYRCRRRCPASSL